MKPGIFKVADKSKNDAEKSFAEKMASAMDSSNQDPLIPYLSDADHLSALGNFNASFLAMGNEFNPGFLPQADFSVFHQQQSTLQSAAFIKPPIRGASLDTWVMTNFKETQPTKKPVEEQNTSTRTRSGKKQKTENPSKIERGEEISDEWNPADFKANSKNTYINKIQKLVEEVEVPKVVKTVSNKSIEKDLQNNLPLKSGDGKSGMKKVKSCELFVSTEEEKLHLKLAKNRESARNSRKRKKIYIDLLEKKVNELTQELFAARKQIEANNATQNQANIQSKLVTQMQNGKQQLFERLEKLVQAEADESEINMLLDSLRLRMGASANDRIQLVNYFYKQAVDQILPIHMKYLLWAASEGKDLFSDQINPIVTNTGDNSATDYWAELLLNSKLTDSQRKYILKYRKKLNQEKHRIEALIHSLNQTRKNILKQSMSLENVLDDLRNSLSPVQVARFLIALDKERYRKEFSAEKLWQFPGTKEEEHEDEEDDRLPQNLENFEAMLAEQNGSLHKVYFERGNMDMDFDFFKNAEADPLRKKMALQHEETD